MKKILLLSLSILVLLLTVACGSSPEKQEEKTSSNEQSQQNAEDVSSDEQKEEDITTNVLVDMSTDYIDRVKDGWKVPTHADLQTTEWNWEGELNGRNVKYFLKFDEWTVDVTWNDGIDEADHEYFGAPYELNLKEKAELEIDFREMNGKMYFNLLISPNGDRLFVLDTTDNTHRILNK